MINLLPQWGLAISSGLMFPLGLAPFDFWLMIPVSTGLFYIALRKSNQNSVWSIGYAYGCGFFAASVSWIYISIHIYGHTPVLLAAAITTLFCGGLALLFSFQARFFHVMARSYGIWSIIQFTSIWVLFEWLRTWLLTGFPWAFAGYAALESPLAGWIPIIGVYGCSWLLVCLGCIWAELLINNHLSWSQLGLSSAITVILLLSGYGVQQISWTRVSSPPLNVAIVQPNIPLKEKWDRRFRETILANLEDTTSSLLDDHDLVVWPESAIPGYKDQMTAYIQRVDLSADRTNTAILIGVPTREGIYRYNSIEALGAGEGLYHKQKLVPFGEYIPLDTWLRGLINFFDLPMSEFSPGPKNQPNLQIGPIKISPFICYEIVYPDFVVENSIDANLLVTISNDTWFGASSGPLQHFQMARFRAAELGRELIRGTNDGVSALVDYRGVVKVQSPQFTESVVSGEMQPRSGHTPFAITGSLPILGFAILILILGRKIPQSC